MNKLFGSKAPVVQLTEADYIVFRAAKEGNMEMLQQGLALGGRANAHGNDGESPVCVAAFNGHANIIRALATAGGDVNSMDKFRGTPLHLGAFQGHVEVCLTLLALKANPRAKNSRGQYPFEVATNDRIKTILRTFKPIKHRTLMHYAAENGNLALVEWIINGRFGNAVTAWDKDHNAPLHFASARGYYDICKALLMAGADKTIYNRGKQQPIDVAKTEAIRHLIENYEHHRYVNVDGTPATRAPPVIQQPSHDDHHNNNNNNHHHHNDDEDDEDDDDEDDDGDHGQKATAHVPGVDAAQLAADPFDEFVSLRAQTASPAPAHTDEHKQMYTNYANPTSYSGHSPAVARIKTKEKRPVSWNPGAAPQLDVFADSVATSLQNAAPLTTANAATTSSSQQQQQQQQHPIPTIIVQQPDVEENPVVNPNIPMVANKAIAAMKKKQARQSWSPFQQ